jgi:hypothetical protein
MMPELISGIPSCAPTAPMDAEPVEHIAALAGFDADQAGDRDRPEPLPLTHAVGVRPLRAHVRCPGGRRVGPASSSKTIHAPVAAASLVPWPRSWPASR